MTADHLSVIKIKNQVMPLSQSAVKIGWNTSQSPLDSTRKIYVSIPSYIT